MSQGDQTGVETQPIAPAASSHVRQVDDLSGTAGRLEAILNTGLAKPPLAAVLCHPYPPAGGTMHTKVVYHAMKVLTSLGIPVLRFNFRGVGLSAGTFDHGRGEQDDARAALEWLGTQFRCPLLLAGFSFGAYVGLHASCSDARVIARIGLGLPVRAAGRDYHYEFLRTCPGPMLFLSGGEDEFCPPAMLRELVQPSEQRFVVSIPHADHFFQGTAHSPGSKLSEMQIEIRTWLETAILPRLEEAPLNPA